MKLPRGILKATMAALAFGLFSVLVALEYRAGANLGGAILLRLAGTMPLAMVVWTRRDKLRRLVVSWYVVLVLILAQAISGISYIAALGLLSPADVVTVVYIYPALTFLGAFVIGWSRPSIVTIVAIVLSFVGVVISVGGPSGTYDPLGTGLAAITAVSYAITLLLTQRLLLENDALLLASVVTLTAGMTQAVVFLGASTPELPVTAVGWIAGISTGLLSTALAYTLLYSAIDQVGAPLAAIVLSFELIAAIVGAGLVLRDAVSLSTAIGAALIISAVILASRFNPGRQAESVP